MLIFDSPKELCQVQPFAIRRVHPAAVRVLNLPDGVWPTGPVSTTGLPADSIRLAYVCRMFTRCL